MRGEVGLWLLLAITAACVAPRIHEPAVAPIELPVRLEVLVGNRVVSVPLEDYVMVTALSEVSPLGESEATVARIFDIQTVIARTYAVRTMGRHEQKGYDFCDTTHCQLYQPDRLRTSRFAAAVREAVQRTKGLILAYGSHAAEAVFHSDCGGTTTDAEHVWGRPVPYLLSLQDDVDESAHRTWDIRATATQLRTALNADARSSVGGRLDAISIASRDPSGRAMTVSPRGEKPRTIRGEDFRSIINRALGPRALQSTRFSVAKSGQTYAFTGAGFGHGVGLCQRGAMARARAGQALAEILTTYYPGTRLVRTGAADR